MSTLPLTRDRLDAALPLIAESPRDQGTLELIVRRPAEDTREVLDRARLDPAQGLVGDTWNVRGSTRTADGRPHPDMQLNIMNARVIALLAQTRDRWALAGDQLYVDLNLSEQNLPAGTRLRIGEALIEITDQPHLGCRKFVARFGLAAMQFVNDPALRHLRLRGLNARVVRGGEITTGGVVEKAV